jgi:acetoin utilization deacetylase AcuC-like enzyme
MLLRMQVSAGYDAHWRDPLASLQMRSSTYYRLAERIKQLADRLAGKGACRHFHCQSARRTLQC